jgi:glutathionylspermidine synthase
MKKIVKLKTKSELLDSGWEMFSDETLSYNEDTPVVVNPMFGMLGENVILKQNSEKKWVTEDGEYIIDQRMIKIQYPQKDYPEYFI